MKVVLIQPPQMWPFASYLSLPSLAGYLRRLGHDVLTLDANLEVYDRLYSRPGLEDVLARATERLRWLERKPSLDWPEQEEYHGLVERTYARLPTYIDAVEGIKRAFRDIKSYRMNPDGSLPLEGPWRAFQQVKELVLPDYPNRLALPALTLARLRRSVDGSEPLLYDHILDDIARRVADAGPGVVGLSFTFSEQVLGGLTLAHHIKRRCPQSHIVAGGSFISTLRDDLERLLPELPFVDSVVLDEGEQALAALVEAVGRGTGLDGVPGIAWVADGRCRRTEPAHPLPMDELPCPDYSDVPLSRYFAAEPVLLYATARGCYWGKCAFCNFSLLHRRFRVRRPELVADDLAQLRERYSRLFLFVQECEPPARMRKLARSFIDRGLDIDYWLLARMEPEFDRGLAGLLVASGCRYVFFGLEAGSDRVNNQLMSKGIDLQDARRVIACCADAGLNIILSSIRGFPGETPEEFEETRAFYDEVRRRHAGRIRITGGSHLFRLNRGSDVDIHPEKYRVVPEYRRSAGELATVYRSFRLDGDDGSRLAALRQQVEDEAPEILYNDLLVLIATAQNPPDLVKLITSRARQAPPPPAPAAGWQPDGALLRLAPGVSVSACRFPVAELQRRARQWRGRARELFIVQGLTLEEVAGRLAEETPPLAAADSLVVAGGAAGEALALSARLGPILDALKRGATLGELTALAAGDQAQVQEQLRRFLQTLWQRGFLETRARSEGVPS